MSCTAETCGDHEPEVALDIEEAISMAPGLSQVLVYVAVSNDADIFNRMATDNIAKSLSCSWGWEPADPTSDDPIFKEFAAQGQSLFVASGDNGAYSPTPPGSNGPYVYPAEDAYVTSVGGTDLTTTGPGGAWVLETANSDSGGGISPDDIPIPTWQQTMGVITAKGGSTIYRNIPDVAAEANTDNYICYSGNGGGDGSGQHCDSNWGGTSFAAPRWAGYIALVNQQFVANTGSTVGFINPAIYTTGLGSSYGTDLHDITSGSNGTDSAVTGYDLVTGWGSPNARGSLTVTISPAGAVSDGAMWNVDGGGWQGSGSTVSNLSAGSHTVAFSGLQGWTAPSSRTVTIPSGQTASTIGTYIPFFTASPTSGKAPLKVHFSNRSIGSFNKVLWHFGNGKTSKTWTPSYTYTKAGTYTVTLTLTGASGTVTCTQPGYITAYTAPKARFSAAPRSGNPPLVVNFTNESTGIVTSWLWSFGDGTTSTGVNPTHTYNSPGTFKAGLTVHGPGGSSSKTVSIKVK